MTSKLIAKIILAALVVYPRLMWSSEPIINEIPEDAGLAMQEFDLWKEDIYRVLEDADLPVHWANRGLSHFSTWRKQGYERSPQRGWQLLQKVLDQPESSAAALYVIAKSCGWNKLKNWCLENMVIERLIEADPDNMAVYLVDFPSLYPSDNDEIERFISREATRERLRRASEAQFVDGYHSRDAADWAGNARKASIEIPPPESAVSELIKYYEKGIPKNKLHGHHRPIEGVIWNHVHTGVGILSSGLPKICGMMAMQSDEEGVRLCTRMAEVLRYNSYEGMMAYIGLEITKHILAKSTNISVIQTLDAPQLYAEFRVIEDDWRSESTIDRNRPCFRPIWSMNGVIPNGGFEDLNLYYKDLQDLNYFEANERAVDREWAAIGMAGTEQEASCETIYIMRSYWPNQYPIEEHSLN